MLRVHQEWYHRKRSPESYLGLITFQWMDVQTRLEILNEVIPLAVSFQYCAHRRILTAEDVAMAMELLGYTQVMMMMMH